MSVHEGTHLFNTAGPDMDQLMPYDRLKLAIIHRAVLDWDKLVRAKAWDSEEVYYNGALEKFNFTEIREFFRSDWCAMILDKADSYQPLTLLGILEKRLSAAMAGEKERAAL